MAMQSEMHVITGGPGVGKTTLIEILASRGYTIVPEAARKIIEQKRVQDSSYVPRKDLFHFQTLVAEEQLKNEAAITSFPAFLDRGLVDGYAYSLMNNISVPDSIEAHARNRYAHVFVLDPLPSYERDHVRHEHKTLAERIHEEIRKAYTHYGYTCTTVPVFASSDERADFVLRHVKVST
jgi:predicted ATPase